MSLDLIVTGVGILSAGVPAALFVATRRDLAQRPDSRSGVEKDRPGVRVIGSLFETPQAVSRLTVQDSVVRALRSLANADLVQDTPGAEILTNAIYAHWSPVLPDAAQVGRIANDLKTASEPVEELDLTVRTYNRIKRLDVHETWQLLILPEIEVEEREKLEAWVAQSIEKGASIYTPHAPTAGTPLRDEVVVVVYQDGLSRFHFQVVRDGRPLLTSESFGTSEAAEAAATDVFGDRVRRG